MKKKLLEKLSMPIGILLLVSGIILNKFLPDNEAKDFFVGFLYGSSIILNLYYIFVVSRNRENKGN
jgi:hypothetical protein